MDELGLNTLPIEGQEVDEAKFFAPTSLETRTSLMKHKNKMRCFD